MGANPNVSNDQMISEAAQFKKDFLRLPVFLAATDRVLLEARRLLLIPETRIAIIACTLVNRKALAVENIRSFPRMPEKTVLKLWQREQDLWQNRRAYAYHLRGLDGRATRGLWPYLETGLIALLPDDMHVVKIDFTNATLCDKLRHLRLARIYMEAIANLLKVMKTR